MQKILTLIKLLLLDPFYIRETNIFWQNFLPWKCVRSLDFLWSCFANNVALYFCETIIDTILLVMIDYKSSYKIIKLWIRYSIPILTFTTHWANTAYDKSVVFFLFFPENSIRHFMQIVS